MKAAWYDRQGPAADVLRVGEVPDPSPGPGEVRVSLRYSGLNPGDVKKRPGLARFADAVHRLTPAAPTPSHRPSRNRHILAAPATGSPSSIAA